MDFPPIDEPTTVAINDVIAQCENARRLVETALESTADDELRPFLRQAADAYAGIVSAFRAGLFGSAGDAAGDGTVKGFLRRMKEEVGQRTGMRDGRQLREALLDQQRRVLAAFDAAQDRVTGERFEAILAAKRAIVAGLTAQIEAMAADPQHTLNASK